MDQISLTTSPRSSSTRTAQAALEMSGSAAAGASGWMIRYSRWPILRSRLRSMAASFSRSAHSSWLRPSDP
ncbi:MAG: hypothetical protein ACRDPY_41215 [Streptosporangiaceae bacterium]